jgi:ubiquinone/menaquinone biosynthesis C-methylase UbiE
MGATDDDYHLGTSDEELARLGFQHQVWQDVTQRLWELAGFAPGQTLLDLGSGPGFVSVEMARLVGQHGHVHAVEAADRFVKHLQSRLHAEGAGNVTVHHADVHQLPLENSSVDNAFARWLLCFVEDPQQACNEVARVLKPGGVFVAWDYFNYHAVGIFPEREPIRRLFRAYHRSAEVNGGSYDIAQALPGMLIKSGFEICHLESINRVARPGSNTWSWVSQFTSGYLPKLVEAGLMTSEEASDLRAAWLEAAADPATFFFTPPMLGIVAHKL